PDGKLFVAAGNGSQVTVWDVASGKEQPGIQTGQGLGLDVALSPDGKVLASVGHEARAVRLWSLSTGKERLAIRLEGAPVYPLLQFSPDGKLLVTAALGQYSSERGVPMRLWDVATGRERLRF